jgi:hypothetical protein
MWEVFMNWLRSVVLLGCALAIAGAAQAQDMVSTIVNAPLSATGTVTDARVGINVYLQRPEAPGIDFMDPKVLGYGIPAGGRLEIVMGEGFERDWEVGLSQAAIMLVTGAPQQGLPGAKVGYGVDEGEDENVFVITPTGDQGLPAESLASPAPGSALDPIPQRGIKVIHIGFMQSAFFNRGDRGTVSLRIFDGADKVVAEGSGTIDFLDRPTAQVLPTNFPHKRRNHNWQRATSGTVLGQSEGTVPLTFMLYAAAPPGDAGSLYGFKDGLEGVGVLSTPQLKAMGFEKPAPLARYNGGLILQDGNGDGRLDPKADRIIGGVLANAPKGAKGQELRSLEVEGKPVLSQATAQVAEKPGKRWGGAMLQLQFTAGSKPGLYRPTLALLSDPEDLSSADGSSYTYSIVVE